MGIFDFLKGKKENSETKATDDQLQIDIDRFEKELCAIIPRYISNPGSTVDIKARHQKTNEVIPFAVGFPEQFEPWRTVRSLADRRGLIYELLDSQIGNQLELWQVMERFNDDRYSERALQLAIDRKQDSDLQNSNFWNALARTNFILTNYEEAVQNCLKANEIDSTNIRTKRIYADILHSTGKEKMAHELYNEILNEKLQKDQKMNLPIQSLLGFDGDIVNSPIYAVSWLKSDEANNEETWEWANEEFYFSPHFRSQYAFHLIDQKEYMKGFVKLLQLSKEMPWFKDAVVNSYSLIDQLNLNDSAQEDKTRLKSIMDENNWTVS